MEHASFNPGFPVYIYDGSMTLPKEGTYFLVAGNGIWLHKDMANFRGFVPVDNISLLQDLNADDECESKLPRLPARHVWRIKHFFKEVVRIHRAEACTVLYYNRDKDDWKIHIPKQQVSHGGVNYKKVGVTHLEGMEGYLPVGTIHSHCDFGAFHSGTDVGDEEHWDGLHVTFGHNDKDDFTISATFVMNGHRFKVQPEEVLEGISKVNGDVYRLIDSDHDPEHHEWATGLDKWLGQVTSGCRGWGFGGWGHKPPEPAYAKGDKVAWKGDAIQMKQMIGDGPFEVLSYQDGKLSIATNVGVARLSEKLFKKEEA